MTAKRKTLFKAIAIGLGGLPGLLLLFRVFASRSRSYFSAYPPEVIAF